MCRDHLLDRRAMLSRSLRLAALVLAGCAAEREPDAAPKAPETAPTGSTTTPANANAIATAPSQPPTTAEARTVASDPASIAARATVPVLCWHQLRDWGPADGAYARRFLICPPAGFRAQLDALAADGWATISPSRYLDHLTTGAALPARPVVLTFDDSQGSQVTEGLAQLTRRDMTAGFFCMTVVLDKPGWMSSDDVRRIADAGMTVGAHTYDHQRVDRYADDDWSIQLDQPRELLEGITGRPVEHFAYPFGAWAPTAFDPLRAAGYRTAFQLADQPLDPTAPVHTLRRILVDSTWTGDDLLAQLRAPI